jgi:hypothetical protein
MAGALTVGERGRSQVIDVWGSGGSIAAYAVRL